MLAAAMSISAAPTPDDQHLLLDIVVNGRAIGQVGEFDLRAGALWARRSELETLGLKVPPGAAAELVRLDAVPGLASRLDMAKQSLAVTAADGARRPEILQPAANEIDGMPIESGTGAVLNYNFQETMAAGRSQLDGLLDGRIYSPWGVLGSGAIARMGAGGSETLRLDTTYTYSDPDTLRRVRVGDVISSGLAWTRPVRLGGAQVARDFTLRPDLVTFPVPSIAGQVAVPSTVDVLVNGVQTLSANAGAGPFEVRGLPVVNGANDVAVLVNNALGQQVARTLPVYASTSLLAPGLDAYSAEIGAVRLNYGFRGDDYRGAAGSTSYRRGITDWLTLSGHAEAADRVGMGGGGAAVSLGRFGVVSGTLAGSAARGRSGLLGYAEFERVTPSVSVSASFQYTTPGFRDLASLFGDPVPTRAVRASAGLPVGRAGSFNLAYVQQRRAAYRRSDLFGTTLSSPITGASSLFAGPSLFLPYRSSLVSASYTVPLFVDRLTFYATGFHDFDNRSSSGAMFGLTMALGQQSSVSAALGQSGSGNYASVQATRSTVDVGDVGGQFYASPGTRSQLLASGQYRSPFALLNLDASRSGGTTAWRAGANGAIVLADNHVFASNAIPDSFAVVDTGGQPGVQVLYENRPVEQTGASGLVLVPSLRSFEANRVSIDPSSMPMDAEFGATARVVRPADRSGLVLDFKAKPSRGALFHLVDARGAFVPVGATAQVEASGAVEPVGYEGAVFLRDLPPHAKLRVVLPGGGACRAEIDYKAVAGDLPDLGRVPCAS